MNLIIAWWHQMWADADDEELHRRTREHSCSDVWACHVVRSINYRRARIEELRASSRTLRFCRAMAAAFRDLRR